MLTLLKGSEIDVLSLAEVKAHLRLDHASEDDYLHTLIQATTVSVENYLGKSLISKTWKLVWHLPQGEVTELVKIFLPHPPLLEVVSVNKVFANDRKQQIKRYFLDMSYSLPKLVCASSYEPIEITYRAGYGDYPKHVPASIRQAILLKIADFYENRTTSCYEKTSNQENLFKELLAPYRQIGLV
jgi:uncharacterized phiE125 gp8 family phage protein